MKRKWICLIIICLICGSFWGCDNTKNVSNTNSAQNTEQSQTIKRAEKVDDKIFVEDIDWSVNQSPDENSEPLISLNYTNNTDYTITELEIKFNHKQISTKNILLHNAKFASSGESVENSKHYYGSTTKDILDLSQYNITNPSEIKIKWIASDNTIRQKIYDCETETYSNSTEIEELYVWNESDLTKMLPKPEFTVVKSSEENNELGFYFYDVSKEEYEKYTKDCERFFDKYFKYYPGYSYGKNNSGYLISMWYDSENDTIKGSLR